MPAAVKRRAPPKMDSRPMSSTPPAARSANRIEDYALIGDTHTPRWSAATARSTGCACRASTPAPASPRCSATPSTAAGCSRPPASVRRVDAAATATARWSSKPSSTTDERHRRASSTACRRASGEPDVVRIVEGRARARSRCGCELVIRFDYGAIVPWVRSIDGGICGDRRARTRCALRTPVPTARRGPHDRRPTSRSAPGERVPSC